MLRKLAIIFICFLINSSLHGQTVDRYIHLHRTGAFGVEHSNLSAGYDKGSILHFSYEPKPGINMKKAAKIAIDSVEEYSTEINEIDLLEANTILEELDQESARSIERAANASPTIGLRPAPKRIIASPTPAVVELPYFVATESQPIEEDTSDFFDEPNYVSSSSFKAEKADIASATIIEP